MTNIRWRIVILLMIPMTINYIDRVNLFYAAPRFMKQLGIGPAEMGIVLSAFIWTYFLLQMPMGLAFDRFCVRFLYSAAALLWGGRHDVDRHSHRCGRHDPLACTARGG